MNIGEKIVRQQGRRCVESILRLAGGTLGSVAVASFNSTDSRANSNVTLSALQAYNIQTVEKLEALLAEAIAATEPGSIERKRVEFFAPWSKILPFEAYCTMVIPTYEVKRVGRQVHCR